MHQPALLAGPLECAQHAIGVIDPRQVRHRGHQGESGGPCTTPDIENGSAIGPQQLQRGAARRGVPRSRRRHKAGRIMSAQVPLGRRPGSRRELPEPCSSSRQRAAAGLVSGCECWDCECGDTVTTSTATRTTSRAISSTTAAERSGRTQLLPVVAARAARCLRASVVSGRQRAHGVKPSSLASRTGNRSTRVWSGHRQRSRW
jgi:hypothetical protein